MNYSSTIKYVTIVPTIDTSVLYSEVMRTTEYAILLSTYISVLYTEVMSTAEYRKQSVLYHEVKRTTEYVTIVPSTENKVYFILK